MVVEEEGVDGAGRKRRNDGEVEGWGGELRAPAAACTVRSCEGVRRLRRERRREGEKRVRERVWLAALLSLSHQIRRSSEREMPLCSKTSLLPPQTVAAGIQAH